MKRSWIAAIAVVFAFGIMAQGVLAQSWSTTAPHGRTYTDGYTYRSPCYSEKVRSTTRVYGPVYVGTRTYYPSYYPGYYPGYCPYPYPYPYYPSVTPFYYENNCSSSFYSSGSHSSKGFGLGFGVGFRR